MPSQIILFSQPRSGCHLLERMVFSKQPNLKQCWHPLSDIGKASHAMMPWLRTESLETLPDDSSASFVAEVEKGCRAWKEALNMAGDQILFVHEHACVMFSPERTLEVLMKNGSNVSSQKRVDISIPDELLLHSGTVPIFTIRHPVLSVPSSYRAINTLFPDPSTANYLSGAYQGWNRDLYDFYISRGITPIVVDADDYMTSEEFVRHIAAELGLDPNAAVVKWTPMSEQERKEMHPMLLQIQHTLTNSGGLVPTRSGKSRDIKTEEQKWSQEFSAEVEKMFHEQVRVSMPHYEYLRERRLRL